MVLYKYNGTGVIAFWVDGVRYEVGVDPRLKIEVDLPRKLTEQEVGLIGGIELIEEARKGKEKKTKGEF